jgi:hypothetical protein
LSPGAASAMLAQNHSDKFLLERWTQKLGQTKA